MSSHNYFQGVTITSKLPGQPSLYLNVLETIEL